MKNKYLSLLYITILFFVKQVTVYADDLNIKSSSMSVDKVSKIIILDGDVRVTDEKNNQIDLRLIKGDVLRTLKDEDNLPKKISFLRLDTDLYTTTKFELEILFPRLVSGGILHIDDYGLFPGVQKAVTEYFEGKNIWLHRVDFTTRLLIKE